MFERKPHISGTELTPLQPRQFDVLRIIRRGTAIALAGVALTPSGALGQAEQAPAEAVPGTSVPAQTTTPECPINLLQGPDTTCENDIPPACVNEYNRPSIEKLRYLPSVERTGEELATVAHASQVATAEIGVHEQIVQDDAAMVENQGHQAGAAFYVGRLMKATVWRTVIYPYRFWPKSRQAIEQYKNHTASKVAQLREQYINAFKAAKNCGYKVMATIAVIGEHWNDSRLRAYTKYVTEKTKPWVDEYGAENEPNYQGWQESRPHMTPEETYRRNYTVMYRTIHRYAKKPVLFGEISSLNYPLRFMKRVLTCAWQKGKKACPPLKIDKIAYHPYAWIRSWKGRLPKLRNKKLNVNSKEAGIDAQPLIENFVNQQYQAGRISSTLTPGRPPKITYNEFTAGMTDAKGTMAKRNLSPSQRALFSVAVRAAVCNSSMADSIAQYQLMWPVKSSAGEASDWNSALVTKDGTLSTPLMAIRTFNKNHPHCAGD